MDFYLLIEKIRKRPALYLGKASLSHLQVLLDGYTFALRPQKSLLPQLWAVAVVATDNLAAHTERFQLSKRSN